MKALFKWLFFKLKLLGKLYCKYVCKRGEKSLKEDDDYQSVE